MPAGEGYEVDFEAAAQCSDCIPGMLECVLTDAQRLTEKIANPCLQHYAAAAEVAAPLAQKAGSSGYKPVWG